LGDRVVGTLFDDGSQVLQALFVVSGLDLDHTQQGASVVVVRVQLQDEGQLFARPVGVATKPQQLGELEPNVVEFRTEPKGTPELVHCVLRTIEVEVRPAKRAVKIRDFASAIGVVG
jgi:hypothetical protein